MNICEKCKKEHDGTFGSGRFCSRPCAASRPMTPEKKLAIQAGIKKYIEKYGDKLKHDGWAKNPEALARFRKRYKETTNRKLLEDNFDEMYIDRKRKRVLLEQKNKCNKCGIDSWNDKPITLELEHIDGNNKNDVRSNLEALCPNCHSQTKTFRGRNIANFHFAKYTKEELQKIYETEGNLCRTLRKIGATPRGGNYRILKERLGII